MEIVKGIFLVLHLLSWALVLGGWFATIRNPQVTPGMMHGSFGALLFGVILMGLAEMSGDPNRIKLGFKGLIAVAVVLLLTVARRRLAAAAETANLSATGVGGAATGTAVAAPSNARVLINLAGALVIINVAIAVLWR